MSEESHYAKVQAHALATTVGVQMEQMSWTFASLASVDPHDVDSATDGSGASLNVAQFQRFIERHHTLGAMEAVRGGRRVHVWSVTGGVVFRPKPMVMTPPAADRPWPPSPPRSVTIAPGRAHGPISMIQDSHKPVHREYLE